MGSDSDAEVMGQACAALDDVGVAYEMKVASAHRSPERTKQVIKIAVEDVEDECGLVIPVGIVVEILDDAEDDADAER